MAISMKVLFLSTGVLSAAVLLKLYAPLIFEFAVSDVPFLYGSVISWLRPPYLYILINFIIMSIVASSKLHHKTDNDDAPPPEIVSQPPHPPAKVADYAVLDGVVSGGYEFVTPAPVDIQVDEVVVREVETIYAPPLEEAGVLERKSSDDVATVNGGDFLSEEARDPPQPPPRRNDSVEFFSNWSEKENAKPPVSSRFAHRKSVRSSPEEKGLRRVAKPKRRQETLESTWRTITEGRAMPLARHLKKSDKLESHARRVPGQDDPNLDPMMKKSETFQDRSNGTAPSRSGGSGKLKKEASLTQDELNRRVEAFINKFNEEMRLQRQESLNQYQEMIGRGAH